MKGGFLQSLEGSYCDYFSLLPHSLFLQNSVQRREYIVFRDIKTMPQRIIIFWPHINLDAYQKLESIKTVFLEIHL